MEIVENICNDNDDMAHSSFFNKRNNDLLNELLQNNKFLLQQDNYTVADITTASVFQEHEDSFSYRDIHINAFQKIIFDRLKYINSLINLNKNWVNGNSEIPNDQVINLSKKILKGLNNFIIIDKCLIIPSLIMGPIPTGGFSIEIVINNTKKILLNIYNDMSCELEYDIDDFYYEKDVTINNLQSELFKTYKYLNNIYV